MNQKLPILFLGLLLTLCTALRAQTLEGRITDAETRQPLEAVMVSVTRDNILTDYRLTDADGRFALPWKYEGSRQVSVSLLGYRTEVRTVIAPGRLDIALVPEAVVLKEVQIRPGRISTRKDTVRYDLARFATSKDVHIKDVLKRLPGVDVDENGQVRYKGKPIDHYYVEGMDVTGGRYAQINNNLDARAVKTAEIMENYQSVKALKGKINSEEVALNLKLDPKVRDQWIWNATAGLGGGTDVLWEGGLNALQLGKGRQSIYNYKTNNNGTDLSREQDVQTADASADTPMTAFLTQPGIQAPLDKHRLLFNQTHTLNANRMYKYDDNRSLRLQAGYTRNRLEQQQGNVRLYYQPDDTVRLDEDFRYNLLEHDAFAEARYEDNSERHYLSNRLTLQANAGQSRSAELQQTLNTGSLQAANLFSLIRNADQHTWEVTSTTRYAWMPSRLQLPAGTDDYRQQAFRTDNQVSYLHKRNGLTRQHQAGIKGEWTRDNGFTAGSLALRLLTSFLLDRDPWRVSLSLPVGLKHYFAQSRPHLVFQPTLYASYRPDYHWKFSTLAYINRSAGSTSDLYPYLYRTDYRTLHCTNGLLPISLSQNYQVYGEYKNTAHEFFVTLSLQYAKRHSRTLTAQYIAADTLLYLRQAMPNHTEQWSVSTHLSKGYYDWNLKTSLELSLNRSTGKQLTLSAATGTGNTGTADALPQNYRYDYLKAEPKIIWTPVDALEVQYHGTFAYGGSKIGDHTRLSPLLDMVNRLHLTLGVGDVYLRLSGEHYRNDLGGGNHQTTLLADATLTYRHGRWRFEASVRNLFDKRTYAYTNYTATQSYTYWLNICPREGMAKVSYQF